MEKVKKYLTYIIFAAFPIMSIVNITTTAKFNLALSDIFVLILGLVWLIDIKNFSLKKNYPYWWYFIGLIAIGVISGVYNLNSDTVSSGPFGIVSEMLKFVINAVYLFVGYNSFKDKRELKKIIISLTVGLWIFMLYGLYAQITVLCAGQPWRFNNTLGNHTRFLGTLTDSNAAAFYMSICFFVLLWAKDYIFEKKYEKLLAVFTNIICTVCIFLTMSRGGIIGFGIAVIIYILFNLKRYIKYIYLLPMIILLVTGLFYADTKFFNNKFVNPFVNRMSEITERTGMFDVRINLSLAAVNMGADNPVIGVGRGNYPLNSKDYISQEQWQKNYYYYYGMVAHNTLAGIFAELGISGLVMFLSLFALMVFKLLFSKELDNKFKIWAVILWLSVIVQSISICLENARVLWIITGVFMKLLDSRLKMTQKETEADNFKVNKYFKYALVAVPLLFSAVIYHNTALMYSYGIIDVSEEVLQADYKVWETGRYTLRYSLCVDKLYDDSKPAVVTVKNNTSGELIEKIEYDKVNGYCNIYFEAENGDDISFIVEGNESTKLTDSVRLINAEKETVIAGNYPLLTKGQLKRYMQEGKLKAVSTQEKDKKYAYIGDLEAKDYIDLGNKIRYKGFTFNKLEDGNTEFEFTFECIGKMEYDYIMWLHMNVEDLNILGSSIANGYKNCDHSLEIPTTQWEVGKEYKHKYITNLKDGEYKIGFGFWLWRGTELSELRLYDKNGLESVNLGWIKINYME